MEDSLWNIYIWRLYIYAHDHSTPLDCRELGIPIIKGNNHMLIVFIELQISYIV